MTCMNWIIWSIKYTSNITLSSKNTPGTAINQSNIEKLFYVFYGSEINNIQS